MSETPTATPDASTGVDEDERTTLKTDTQPSPAEDLTDFQKDLLATIAEVSGDDTHGLAIKDELESWYESEIHHGRLYPNLDTLVDKGLVKKDEIDKRTNSYSLTRRGEREVVADLKWRLKMMQSILK